MALVKNTRLSVDRYTTCSGTGLGCTNLPRYLLKKLAISLIALSKSVRGDQDLPSILDLCSCGFEERLSEHRPLFFAGVVGLNGYDGCKP